jgi:hypothetical protein
MSSIVRKHTSKDDPYHYAWGDRYSNRKGDELKMHKKNKLNKKRKYFDSDVIEVDVGFDIKEIGINKQFYCLSDINIGL